MNGLCHLFGGDLYNEKALAAVVAIDPATVGRDVIESMNTDLRLSPADIDFAYGSAPLEDIACVARWIRVWAPAALRYLDIADLPDGDVDAFAAIFASDGHLSVAASRAEHRRGG